MQILVTRFNAIVDPLTAVRVVLVKVLFCRIANNIGKDGRVSESEGEN